MPVFLIKTDSCDCRGDSNERDSGNGRHDMNGTDGTDCSALLPSHPKPTVVDLTLIYSKRFIAVTSETDTP